MLRLRVPGGVQGLTSLVLLGKQILWHMREMFCSTASTSTWCGGCFRGPVLEQTVHNAPATRHPHLGPAHHQPLS